MSPNTPSGFMDDVPQTFSIEQYRKWAAMGGLEANPPYDLGPQGEPPAQLGEPLPPADPTATVLPAGVPVEMRALWVTRWDYQAPQDLRMIASQAATANFNALFFQVRGNADAYYTPGLEPWAARLSGGVLGQDPGWDPLALAVEEAHAHGLELHAWINVYPAWLGETPPTPAEPEPMVLRFNQLYGSDWVVWNRFQQPMTLNKEYLWSNPAHPAVAEHIVAVGAGIARRYYVDGLHLDNVRYPGWEYSRDPITSAGATEAGVDRKQYQRQEIDALVESLRQAIDAQKRDLPLTAAVWPVYKDTWDWWNAGDGYDGFCQDSLGWLQAGSVGALCPMFYLGSITTDDSQYVALLNDFVARSQGGHIYAGITTTYDDFAPIGRRIDQARQAGAQGQALFAYGHVNAHGYWDDFRNGPYATPARIVAPLTSETRAPGPRPHAEFAAPRQ